MSWVLCSMPTSLGAMPPLLPFWELKVAVPASVYLVAAMWLLVPFALKLIGAMLTGRKLRHLPGPRAGLLGVTPILMVRFACYIPARQLTVGGVPEGLSRCEKHCTGCHTPFPLMTCLVYSTCLTFSQEQSLTSQH